MNWLALVATHPGGRSALLPLSRTKPTDVPMPGGAWRCRAGPIVTVGDEERVRIVVSSTLLAVDDLVREAVQKLGAPLARPVAIQCPVTPGPNPSPLDPLITILVGACGPGGDVAA